MKVEVEIMLIQLGKNVALLWILRELLAGCCLSSAVLLLRWRCWMAAMGKQQLLPPLHF